MVDPKTVSFPLTLEAFTALQEKDMERKVFPAELEFFEALVEMANEAYRAGCVADGDTVHQLLNTVAALDANAEQDADSFSRHLCALCRGWILEGARRGLELAISIGEPADATGGPVS